MVKHHIGICDRSNYHYQCLQVRACKDIYRECSGLGFMSLSKDQNFRVDIDILMRLPFIMVVCYGNCAAEVQPNFPLQKIYLLLFPMNESFLPKKSEEELENDLSFLDKYSFVEKLIPRMSKLRGRYTRHTWIMVYDKYLKYCEKLHFRVARYDRFFAIMSMHRKNHRKDNKKQNCTRACGLDHLQC